MPDRCESRCSTVTSSAISGRSAPSTERAVVASSSEPASIRPHDRQCGQALGAAGEPELGVDRVRDRVSAIGKSIGLGELDLAAAVHAHSTRELLALGDCVEFGLHGEQSYSTVLP